jgi:hypothetical protein
MKILLTIPVFILAFAGFSFGQADENPGCPRLEITGPSGYVAPGDIATYTAKIDSAGRDLELRYQWSISAGQITSGQGTPVITVRQPITGVVATVEITGLPKGCPNMTSETAIIDPPDQPELLERFSGRIRAKDKARYNELYDRLAADPNARGVIFFGGTVPQIKANKKMIMSSFVTRLFRDVPRVTFIDTESQNEMTEFWFVPLGADEPKPGKYGSQIIIPASGKPGP